MQHTPANLWRRMKTSDPANLRMLKEQFECCFGRVWI